MLMQYRTDDDQATGVEPVVQQARTINTKPAEPPGPRIVERLG